MRRQTVILLFLICAGGLILSGLWILCLNLSPDSVQASPAVTAEPVVTIYYEGQTQIELISSRGQRILVDVTAPERLSAGAKAEDIILATQPGGDYYKRDFQSNFKNSEIFTSHHRLEKNGVVISELESMHQNAKRFLFLIEMDGLRLVHLGDIQQEKLNDEQLSLLRNADIVITPFECHLVNGNCQDIKQMTVVSQLQPRWVIPSYTSSNAWRYALTAARWQTLFNQKDQLSLHPSLIKKGTTLVIFPKAESSQRQGKN